MGIGSEIKEEGVILGALSLDIPFFAQVIMVWSLIVVGIGGSSELVSGGVVTEAEE